MDEFIATKEALHDQCRKTAELLYEIERLIIGKDFCTDEDRLAYMKNSYSYYELANKIYRTRLEQKPAKLKVPCKYEMLSVMQAFAISIGAMSEQDLESEDENDWFYDPAWIKEMAALFHEHYRKTAAKNNCKIM